MDTQKIGRQITMLRKERGYTQEALAEALSVSAQAVSKWENGHSLPETSILSDLARILNCSIDSILLPSSLQILEATYGDGLENEDVTKRLNRLVDNDRLSIIVTSISMASNAAKGRKRYLLVKYQNDIGVYSIVTAEGDELYLDNSTVARPTVSTKLEFLAASYGNDIAAYDVVYRLEHLRVSGFLSYHADHATFPSAPNIDGPEYLTVVYMNQKGIQVSTCTEGERLRLSEEKMGLIRDEGRPTHSYVIPNVEALPGFGHSMDCTWAGALTVALRAMGEDASYEKVMGVSGACWRIAFRSPDWDYSSVDGLVMYDYATPGYRAFGYTPIFAERVDKEHRASERQNIINNIKNNRPVLGINLRVAHEWGVICGFNDSGNELLCRTYFDNEVINRQDFNNTPETLERYLFVDNWPFIITYFSEKGTVPTDKENLVNSLKLLIKTMNMEGARGYAAGYDAYRTWQEGLVDDEWYEKADNERFSRRLDVNNFCLLALCDARRAAAMYLKSCVGTIDGDLLNKLAVTYEKIGVKLSGLLPVLPALNGSYGKSPVRASDMRSSWTQELRHRQAELFSEIIDLEQHGEKMAREITR